MARPKYEEGDTQAKERLEDAFWRLLSDKPYAKISVQNVADHAGLNKNTFYYHFDNLEELARDAIQTTLEPALVCGFIDIATSPSDALARVLRVRANRALLKRTAVLFSSNAVPLQEIVISHIASLWCDALGLDSATLCEEDRELLIFSAGGLSSVLSERTTDDYPAIARTIKLDQLLHPIIERNLSDKPAGKSPASKRSAHPKPVRKAKTPVKHPVTQNASEDAAFQQLSIL